MRRAPGIELSKFLETKCSKHEKDDVIVLMKAIINAYTSQIYANGLTHNDLNIGNIMIDWQNIKGDKPIITIVDFTNARERSKDQKSSDTSSLKDLLKRVWLYTYPSEQREVLELDLRGYGTNNYEFACDGGFMKDKSDEVIRMIYKNQSFNVSEILANLSSYQSQIKNETNSQRLIIK